ncbi:AMP-binding protein [Gaiella sp.]|uniref:AMP-binding protein n=1 Tax=Gaiella sp. TaxID=2663207 RepID=UPI003262D74E
MGRFRLRKRVVEAPEPDPLFRAPARFNFTRDVVEAAAAADANRHAMTFVDDEGIIDRRTFKEIAHDASRWTSLLRSRGLGPGDRIVVLVGRTPEWHSVVLGALKGGFVAVPCPLTFDRDELMQRSAHCDARAIVTDRAHAPSPPPGELLVVEDLRQELRGQPVAVRTHDTASDDPAFILYTAGTTGAPKGAIHTHAATWTMRLQAEYWLDARPDDLTWCTADPGSALFVWNSLIGPWSLGSEIALHEGEFKVEERFDLIDRLGVSVLCQPPSEYRQMAEHADLEAFYIGSVRHAVSTGAPLEPAVTEAFRVAFGVAIHDGYGQAETGLVIASRHGTEVDLGALGAPIPGYDIAVIDESGNEQAAAAEGEMALRGRPPSLFTGYVNDREGTEAVFLGEWYLTGDRASRNADGLLSFAGRADGPGSAGREARERVAAAAAAEATAEEARREAEERARQADEERRRQEEQAAAAAAAVVVETAGPRSAEPAEPDAGTASETQSPEEQPAPAKRSRREAAAARRAAKAAAKAAEDEKRIEEKRRREEEKAAAEQARRDEADAKRAAQAAAEEAKQREKESRRTRTVPPTIPDSGDTTNDDDQRISAELIARLRAYGHGDSSEDALKDRE